MLPRSFSILLLMFIFCAWHSSAQPDRSEFSNHKNGFIYSDTAMNKLRLIIDSLNISFRKCDPWKEYLSVEQSFGHYVILEGKQKKNAAKDMSKGIAYDDFRQKYPSAEVDEQMLIIRYADKNWEDKEVTEVMGIDPRAYSYPSVDQEIAWLNDHNNKGKWAFREYDERVYAFYMLTDFKRRPIPEPYGRLIQYADCLIDTNSSIFKEKAQTGRLHSKTRETEVLLAYVASITNKPDQRKFRDNNEGYYNAIQVLDSVHVLVLDEQWNENKKLRDLLDSALREAKQTSSGNPQLEFYVERYISKAEALELKRNRIVVGSCSMDNSPRIHAMDIATLSAETFNWEIFLRAHLDVMNDRFERVSDGSWAWAGRKTYIAELEALDINVADLLLGISLRISNPSGTHYYGDIGRLGRAFTESKFQKQLEEKMAAAIKDDNLDVFNRMVIFNLYRSYVNYLDDEDQKAKGYTALKDYAATFPVYLRSRIDLKEE